MPSDVRGLQWRRRLSTAVHSAVLQPCLPTASARILGLGCQAGAVWKPTIIFASWGVAFEISEIGGDFHEFNYGGLNSTILFATRRRWTEIRTSLVDHANCCSSSRMKARLLAVIYGRHPAPVNGSCGWSPTSNRFSFCDMLLFAPRLQFVGGGKRVKWAGWISNVGASKRESNGLSLQLAYCKLLVHQHGRQPHR